MGQSKTEGGLPACRKKQRNYFRYCNFKGEIAELDINGKAFLRYKDTTHRPWKDKDGKKRCDTIHTYVGCDEITPKEFCMEAPANVLRLVARYLDIGVECAALRGLALC